MTQNNPLILELEDGVEQLREQGFINQERGSQSQSDSDEEDNDDDIDVKKHLSFVFFNVLRLKHEGNLLTENGILFFNSNRGNSKDLMYEAIPVRDRRNRITKVEFQLRHLFTTEDPNRSENTPLIRIGKAPSLRVTDMKYHPEHKCLLIKDNSNAERGALSDKVHIDHIFRDNSATIEVPYSVHKMKTRFLDRLVVPSEEEPIRNPRQYWQERHRTLGDWRD